MNKLFISFALAIVSISVGTHARDLGFRFKDGRCVNDAGQLGLNPSHLGPCGDLRNVILSRLDLDDIDFRGSLFDNSDLQDSTFRGANLQAVHFKDANLSGVNLENTVLHATDFTRAILINSRMAGADVQNSNFSSANLSGALLSYFDLKGNRFTGTIFTGAVLDHVDFSGANLTDALLTNANLKETKFDNADITNANFANADLTKASLQRARGDMANFNQATLRFAQLENGSFKAAKFRSCPMDEANLNQANFNASDMRNASLKNVLTQGSVFTGVKISKKTILPFSEEHAREQGMILIRGGPLFIIGDKTKEDIQLLKTFLVSEGVEVTISSGLQSQFKGTENLDAFSAVLHLIGNDYVEDMPEAGQQALMAFVNSGGTYIGTQWAGYMIRQRSAFAKMRDLVLIDYTSATDIPLVLSLVTEKRSHPLLDGIDTMISVNQYGAPGLFRFTSNPSVTLMKDAAGVAAVAVRELGIGKIVGFAFTPTFDNYICFDQKPVQRLILNAINW